MYWIYLALFILAVMIPGIVSDDDRFFFLKEEQIEEISIFFLGFFGFLIFLISEKRSAKYLKEKMKIQKEAREISKNLTSTYSYIGETNRKLDIIRNISENLLDLPRITQKKELEFYNNLTESIFAISKSEKFVIRFVDTKNKKTKKEIKSKKRIYFKIENSEIIDKIFKKEIGFIEKKYHFVIVSSKEINNTVSAIIISKNNEQQKLEDLEILKSLTAYSLFFYDYVTKEKIIRKLD